MQPLRAAGSSIGDSQRLQLFAGEIVCFDRLRGVGHSAEEGNRRSELFRSLVCQFADGVDAGLDRRKAAKTSQLAVLHRDDDASLAIDE